MNRQRAKEILLLYRPGPSGDGDPEFAEALGLLKQDQELCRWFEAHRAAQDAIRRGFKSIVLPDALKEQIISERPWHTRPVSARHLVATVAVALALFAVGWWWSDRQPSEDKSFAAYRNRMVSTAYCEAVRQLQYFFR